MLNLITAGDQNMVDYVKDYIGPMFEKEHPRVTIRAVGTGPGDAGSQKIYEKLEAEKNNSSWDIDVAVIHQKAAGEMVTKGLLARYVAEPADPRRRFGRTAAAFCRLPDPPACSPHSTPAVPLRYRTSCSRASVARPRASLVRLGWGGRRP